MKRIRLELWAPIELQIAAAPPEAEADPHIVLVGHAFGHPLKEDGAEVSTGKVTAVLVDDNDGVPVIIARTGAGVEYLLGQPDKKYLNESFPNARQAIFDWWYANHPETGPIKDLSAEFVEPETGLAWPELEEATA
jgi:hypothetical protein